VVEEKLNGAKTQHSTDDQNVRDVLAKNENLEHTNVDAEHAKATRTRH
jgi:hypothetical protein